MDTEVMTMSGEVADQSGAEVQTEPAAAESGQTEPAADAADEVQQSDAPQTQPKPWKTPENAAAAQRRRDAERERERQELFGQMVGGLTNPATGRPFESQAEWDGWKRQMAVRAQAQAAGVAPEKAQQLADGLRQTMLETSPEYQALKAKEATLDAQLAELRRQQNEAVFAADLRAIRKAYPDEKAKSIEELGEAFIAMMATGRVSALTAYEAVRGEKQRTAPKPPSTGDVGSQTGAKKGYYTREEVAAMSPEQVQQNLDIINKSMRTWK